MTPRRWYLLMTWGYLMIQSTLKLKLDNRAALARRVSRNRNHAIGQLWFKHIRGRLNKDADPPSEPWPRAPKQQMFPWR